MDEFQKQIKELNYIVLSDDGFCNAYTSLRTMSNEILVDYSTISKKLKVNNMNSVSVQQKNPRLIIILKKYNYPLPHALQDPLLLRITSSISYILPPLLKRFTNKFLFNCGCACCCGCGCACFRGCGVLFQFDIKYICGILLYIIRIKKFFNKHNLLQY